MKILFIRSTIVCAGLTTVLTVMAALGMAQYNASPMLKIGDAAPPIKVHTWVKGKPIKKFEKGKVYVVDFWATWCGGCIASFPHLSKVAEKYKGKVTFFSVDSYEDAGDNKDADPVALVKKFLEKPQGQQLKIDVAVDGKNKSMYDAWIKPLRRQGFPTTFIIDQEGKLAWIDVNLDHLDWALQNVLAKKWDHKKAADIMTQRDAVEDLLFKIFRNKDSSKNNDFQALLLEAEAFETRFPHRRDAMAFYKVMALLELDISKVPAVLEQMAADPMSRYLHLSDAAGLTLRKTNLDKRTYTAVAKVLERLLLNEYPEKGYGGKKVTAYEQLASVYQKAGNTASAISSMEKAIALAHEQKATADQVSKLEQILNQYKSGISVYSESQKKPDRYLKMSK